jgi:hypothetical protein
MKIKEWLRDLNGIEYECTKDFNDEVELTEYPTGFKIKVPKKEIGKSFNRI